MFAYVHYYPYDSEILNFYELNRQRLCNRGQKQNHRERRIQHNAMFQVKEEAEKKKTNNSNVASSFGGVA